jgi:hypothetical protein
MSIAAENPFSSECNSEAKAFMAGSVAQGIFRSFELTGKIERSNGANRRAAWYRVGCITRAGIFTTDYSYRSATIGSTRIARRAGM